MLYARIGGLLVGMSNNPDITIEDFENICRTCLSPDDLKPLYVKWSPSTSLVDMLMSCTVVKFAEDDGLPVKICINCINEITKAFWFAERCEATDIILRKCVKTINTEFVACNSFQAQNIQPKQEIKIEFEPEIPDGTVRDVLGEYKIKEEEDMKREFTSEIILPTEEIFLDDLEQVEEEVTQKEDLNIEYEETFDDPMVENEDEVQDATYSKTSDIPSSRPRRRCIISQMEKHKSKDDDSETCDNYVDESDEHQDESYSEKTTHMRKVLPDSHLKVNSVPQLHACHVCRKLFDTSSNLEVHKLIHTSEKPHVCSVRSKAFEIEGSLKIHMRQHTGKKPYTRTCEICSKAFKSFSYLKKHMRLHTEEKRYTCDVCSMAFIHYVSLKNHMRQHTGQKL